MTMIVADMKRVYKKLFEFKKPSLGSIHGPAPETSTSISTGTTVLMPSTPGPACDLDATSSAQFTVEVTTVSVQLSLSHLY